MTFPYEKLANTLISDLHPRTRDILARRFGLQKQEQEPETLESIGQDHKITRERVRQIVEDGILQVKEAVSQKKDHERLQEIFDEFVSVLRESGYVKRQDLLIQALDAEKAANHIVFLLHLGDQFHKHKETEDVYPFWASKKEVIEMSSGLLEAIYNYLKERKEALEFDELIKTRALQEGEKVSPRTLASLLEIAKGIERAYNGKWGLTEWPEVYPKGMRDKAYVVLRDKGKPLHFVEVAKAIEELQDSLAAQSASWRKKNVLPQTVHNELIKDPRFVLVGRGTYALDEWGYKPGTVRDVITAILRENGEAMTKDEIVKKTLDQRQVKESTILLNLQDKTCFYKEGEGYYCVGD